MQHSKQVFGETSDEMKGVYTKKCGEGLFIKQQLFHYGKSVLKSGLWSRNSNFRQLRL